MKVTKKDIIAYAVAIAVGIISGLWMAHCSHKPVEAVRIEHDTIVRYDTIADVAPKPKDSVRTRYVTRWLPAKRDTMHHPIGVDNMKNSVSFRENSARDSVAVVVPITSKHYGAPEYDAWISGYEPSLDSIKVYQRTEYITERVTISKPPNKWELDAMTGIDYNVTSQHYSPYAGGELLYKPNRLQVGIRGGIIKNDKAEPFAGAVIKYRLY